MSVSLSSSAGTRAVASAGLLALALGLALVPAGGDHCLRADDFDDSAHVGALTCAACHKAEYNVWLNTAHAKAHLSLPEASRNDARCLACHDMRAQAGHDDTFAGVQCESCHGAGRDYSAEVIMRDADLARAAGLIARPDAASCQVCHTPDGAHVGSFDYADAWSRIAHGPRAGNSGKPGSPTTTPAAPTGTPNGTAPAKLGVPAALGSSSVGR